MYNCQDSEKNALHCRYCGARLKEGRTEYCNDLCRRAGQYLWQKQQRRRRKWLNSPLSHIVARVEEYNRANKTTYSYGYFVAYIVPELIKGGKLADEF